MVTAKQISSAIDDHYAFFSILENEVDQELDGIGILEFVDFTVGSGDYGIETQNLVFKVGDQYFRKVGRYNSWDYDDWDGPIYEVQPIEKTITVYEKI